MFCHAQRIQYPLDLDAMRLGKLRLCCCECLRNAYSAHAKTFSHQLRKTFTILRKLLFRLHAVTQNACDLLRAGRARVKPVSDTMLNRIEYGSVGTRPLVIAHGLYGSARNWGVIAKRLSDERHVVAVDMRNHGHSPRFERHDYVAMAQDLADVIADLGGQADVCGHSMGGKAAMVLALTHPDRVRSLIVADIAPVTYTHSQLPFAEAMMKVDLTGVTRRSDVADQLLALDVDADLISFFTQSIDLKARQWLLNLPVLVQEMPKIMSFPDVDGQFQDSCLFLTGANSDYVHPEDRPKIREFFPKARFAKLSGAGHWLHAEKPREFEASVRAFLNHQSA